MHWLNLISSSWSHDTIRCITVSTQYHLNMTSKQHWNDIMFFLWLCDDIIVTEMFAHIISKINRQHQIIPWVEFHEKPTICCNLVSLVSPGFAWFHLVPRFSKYDFWVYFYIWHKDISHNFWTYLEKRLFEKVNIVATISYSRSLFRHGAISSGIASANERDIIV